MIESGNVDIVVEYLGREKTVARLGRGKLFGEMAIIDQRTRMASALASTDCILTIITVEQLHSRLDSLDPVIRLCLDTIAGRLRNAMQSNPMLMPITDEMPSYDPISPTVDRLHLENELKSALESDQLCLHLQPILDLASRQTAGFEALVRWNHPGRGLLEPSEFIPIAESSGLIVSVTEWVLNEACRAREALATCSSQKEGQLNNIFISVNLSARDLSTPHLAERLLVHVGHYELPPECIKLEITESLLMEAPKVAALALSRCRERGFKVAIDDFGTGLASFGYLQDFQVDGLKIDQRFIANLAHSARDKAIVDSMINLAKSLEMGVIAEGIENEDQANVLSHMGCELVQGFLYSHPAPWKDIIKKQLISPKRRATDLHSQQYPTKRMKACDAQRAPIV